MSFELSCCDAAFPKLRHDAALRLIADLDIPYVDICVFAGYEHNPPDSVLPQPAKAATEVAKRVEAANLKVADVFGIWGDFEDHAANHPDAKVRAESRDYFARLLEFAGGLQAKGVTILPGIHWPGESAAVSRQRAADELAWRAQLAASQGKRCSIEPHVSSIVEGVDETLWLVDHAPGLTVTLDYAHFVFQGIPTAQIERLHPVTGHFQARQAGKGMMQASAREGSIDFERIVRLFDQSGFNGFFSLEYCWDAWQDCDRVDCISETAMLRDVFRRVHAEPAVPAGR